MFTHPNPGASENYIELMNPDSLIELDHCKLEPSLAEADPDKHYQFERTGYFVRDNHEEKPVFNRTVTLRDTWAKIDKQNA